MPVFVTGPAEMRVGIQHFTDGALFNERFAGGNAGTVVGLWSGTQHFAFFFSQRDQFIRLRGGGSQRLFRKDVFAGIEGCFDDLVMILGRSQIDHNINIFSCQQLFHRQYMGNVPLGCFCLRNCTVNISHSDDLGIFMDIGEILTVNLTDMAGTDDANFCDTHSITSQYFCCV